MTETIYLIKTNKDAFEKALLCNEANKTFLSFDLSQRSDWVNVGGPSKLDLHFCTSE